MSERLKEQPWKGCVGLVPTKGSNPFLSVNIAKYCHTNEYFDKRNTIFIIKGFEPQKGVGKGFSHVVGVTGAERRQRGRAPMEIRLANLGSNPALSVLRCATNGRPF